MDVKALLLLIIGAGAGVAKVLWNLYLSPLARQRLPGPKRAAMAEIWDYWSQLRQRRSLNIIRLFERYGPVVRTGPNRVAFQSLEAIKTIYNTHNFRKSDWYKPFYFGGSPNIMSTDDPVYHAHCRRLCAPAFRGENLRAAGHVLRHEMEDLVDRFRRDCINGDHVDVLQLFPQLTLDILGLTVLGVRFNQIATGKTHTFQKQIQSMLIDKIVIRPLPSVVRKLPIPWLQEIVTAESIITNYMADLYVQTDESSLEGRASMLGMYKAYRDADTGEPASLPMVVSDLTVMFIAGSETTALALTYATYHLASHEEVWGIIRTEISAVDVQAEDLTDTLRGLTYLNGFTREILRVHGAGSIFFPRIVPAGGAMIDGYLIPEGTEVGGLAYGSHLDERIFPQPYVIDPLRWVRLDKVTGRYVNREDVAPETSANYFPFGIGVRSCVGKPLADLELALALVTIIKNFRIHLHETTTPASMSHVELGAMRPKAGRCLLHFEYVGPV